MGVREKNKAMTLEKLLKEGMHLFAEQGFRNTTISDIVEACGIAKGTFYNYFEDSKALFDALIDQANRHVSKLMHEARKNETDTYQFLYLSFKTYFDFVSEEERLVFHRKNQEFIRSTSYGSESILMVVNDLEKALKEQLQLNIFQDDKSLRLLSFTVVGTGMELFLNVHSTDLQISNHDLATFLAKLYTDGLAY